MEMFHGDEFEPTVEQKFEVCGMNHVSSTGFLIFTCLSNSHM